ncbi:hypothetical protein CCACVL1_06623, partial [Corchorus capsularis]
MAALEFLLSDELLGAIVPVVMYWLYSGIYMVLEPYSQNYRLHSKKDEDQKNLVSKEAVIKRVLFLQFLQILSAILLFMVW